MSIAFFVVCEELYNFDTTAPRQLQGYSVVVIVRMVHSVKMFAFFIVLNHLQG